ncbi:tail fiber assembly protein [Escherichia coli]|uniref:Tail fiber assembly protein n=2 Tax=Escherichia coli TaxID=562 RepID=A0A839AWU1_ECOLX|nr:tail fiber assembly protein [Escherichia coli]EEZ5876433.1 tail fiber assembly protein [Escherichia coli O102]APJ90431.1 phage tail fiber protein [Escherichia coli]APJ95956.1 phage tail fiber protein [Escherichia coli]EEV5947203.1 tail fiber assembly protein [Escherichia coli]EEV9039062.1 tail fiber assembly protein [Escherichia coli]
MKTRYFYDAVDNGFYIEPESRFIPESAIEISVNLYNQFAGIAWPEGKMLGADSTGLPAWVDAPPPTHEELIEITQSERQLLINQANEYMNSKQWPGKAAIGRLKGDELAQYNLWLDYLDALELVDTSGAPDIEWPTPPAVQAR